MRRTLDGFAEPLLLASNLPRPASKEAIGVRGRSSGDTLRVVFLSRIMPKKNLVYALRVLQYVRVPVKFSIYGPVEDRSYWSECLRLLDCLPDNVKVEYRGEVQPDDVPRVLRAHDLFFLPTRGESYGHAIAEALSVGHTRADRRHHPMAWTRGGGRRLGPVPRGPGAFCAVRGSLCRARGRGLRSMA